MKKEKKNKHRDAILKIIHKFRNQFSIIDCYFKVDATIIAENKTNEVEFALGPSFKFENEWTIKKHEQMKEAFGEALAVYCRINKFDGLIITTEYRSWAVWGYQITIITNL